MNKEQLKRTKSFKPRNRRASRWIVPGFLPVPTGTMIRCLPYFRENEV